jgi:hypothetical protein
MQHDAGMADEVSDIEVESSGSESDHVLPPNARRDSSTREAKETKN